MYVNQRMSTVEIQNITGFNNTTIGRMLHRHGVKVSRTTKLTKLDPAVVNEICERYVSGETTRELGQCYLMTDNSIAKILRQNNIEIRKAAIRSPIKNHNYFHEIDTKEKAYFLGWMITDGSVVVSHNELHPQPVISLCMIEQDKYILERFLTELDGDISKIGIHHKERKNPLAYYRFSSYEMAEDLSKYGVVPNKSWITYLPMIREDLMPHLIRGIFDGDGTITIGKQNGLGRFAFYGSEEICLNIRDYLNKTLGFGLHKVSKSTCYHVWYSSMNDNIRFFDYIYNDSEGLRLERKYMKFLQDYNTRNSRQGNTEVTQQIA